MTFFIYTTGTRTITVLSENALAAGSERKSYVQDDAQDAMGLLIYVRELFPPHMIRQPKRGEGQICVLLEAESM
jgi:hypothetical protein